MSIKFNAKQKEVFEQLQLFVKNKEQNVFILNGYAGTGKTFLIQQFANYLKKEKIKFSLLATTGRAAAVLRGKTDLKTYTVHGELYAFSKVDGDDDKIPDDAGPDAFGQMKLVFEPRVHDDEKRIYIIDEASMLGSELGPDTSFAVFGTGQLLHDLLHAFNKNKIIFVGDPCQLPPIAQTISPALDEHWLKEANRAVIVQTLNQIMRTNKDNDILVIASEIRKLIGKPKVENWTKLPARNRNNCTLYPDGNTLFLEYYVRFVEQGPQKTIAIARSNSICNKINRSTRLRLFPDSQEIIQVGEILMVTQNNYLIPLTNGDFVKITEIGKTQTKEQLQFVNIKVLHLETQKSYSIKLCLDPLINNSPNLNTDQQRMLMIDFSRRMRKKNIRPKSSAYNESMRKDAYLNSLKASYGYCVTCHKAQGGEWDFVYLFLDKGMYAIMNNDQLLRWWYTAITRTKQHLYLHDDWWLK